MRRLLYLFLTISLLLTQLGLVAHAYQDHDATEVCHLCLTASQHDHALISTPSVHAVERSFVLFSSASSPTVELQFARHYAVRAPPRFL